MDRLSVRHYGRTPAFQHIGGQSFRHLAPSVAEQLAASVVERIFREGAPEQQCRLLKEELERHAGSMERDVSSPFSIEKVYGVAFPLTVKPFLEKVGVERRQLNQDPDSVTFEQAKRLLTLLEDVRKQRM